MKIEIMFLSFPVRVLGNENTCTSLPKRNILSKENLQKNFFSNRYFPTH